MLNRFVSSSRMQEVAMNQFFNFHKQMFVGCSFGVMIVLALLGCQAKNAAAKPLVIGVINLSPQLEPVWLGFQTGLAALGYDETQVTYIYAGPAPDIETLDELAEDLVAAEVDLILSISTPATQAAYRATLDTDVPVIFAPVTDPVAASVVNNTNQPGGNVTGVTLGTESEGQRLQWLLRLSPDIQRIYLPYNKNDASAMASVDAVLAAATLLNVTIVTQEVSTEAEIYSAIETIPDDVQAIFLAQDSLVAAHIVEFAAAAIAQQLPLCTPTDGQVEQGALVSYSFRLNELGQQAARLADQIFKGTPPADLPVETAEFFLTINLKTAEAIHLTISDDILRTADRVIR
jgi:putative ABC transport system substrate-binding protein